MSCNITATSSCAVECMEPGRAQTEAHCPTITSSNAQQPTNTLTPHRIVQVSSPPSLEEYRHDDSRDNTHNDEERLNQLTSKIADIGINGCGNKIGTPLSKIAGIPEAFTQAGDSEHPVIVTSTQPSSPPPLGEQPDSMPLMIDEPDPKLLDALQKPIDRPLILKLEQEVIAFITGVLDSYDTTSLNSYHRMLVHKIAEFYRLTHIVSPEANDCVRLFRGHAARIPPIKLSDMANAKSPPDTPPSGPQVKIMRRKSPSQLSSNGEIDQSGDGKGNGKLQGNDPLKQKTREEKEAAYQLARARIFGDFKESPPESPSPLKNINEKQALQRNNRGEDEFQSRSQYYPVSHSFQTVGPRFTSLPQSASGFSGPPQSAHTFNPAALSFNPNASSFIPSSQFRPTQQMMNQQQYPISLSHGSGYPHYAPPQPQHIPFPVVQSNYGRPPVIPNIPNFSGTPTMQSQLSRPQASYGSNFIGMHGLSPTGAGFGPSTNSKQAIFNRTPDPHASKSATYPPNFTFSGHQNNILQNVNGTLNGGWPPTKSQQGRFQQGERPPLADELSGNSALYGAGRG